MKTMIQQTPTRNRVPEAPHSPSTETLPLNTAPSTSKSLRWDSCLPASTRTLLQSRETRKRTVLIAACAVFALVILYANTSMTHQKAKLVLEWESASGQKFGKKANLHAAKTCEGIPHIIHQSWESGGLAMPASWGAFTKQWRSNHLKWNHRFWSEDDNARLVKEHYPWLAHFYSSLSSAAQRADIAKYLYLHKYGGVYASVATYSAQPLDASVLSTKGVLLMPITNEHGAGISTAFMASEPLQPFWLFVVSKAASYAVDMPLKQEERHENTGANMLYRAVHHYKLLHQDSHNITLLGKKVVVDAYTVAQEAPSNTPCVLVPVDAFTNASCTAQFPEAYVFVTGLNPLTEGVVSDNATAGPGAR